jgi:type VI secretion system secreted protein Hcp
MAFDVFVKIDGIEGESTDYQHAGWIEIEAIRFGTGVTQSTSSSTSSAGGATSGRADFSDFTLRKLLDKSSPKLALACAAGTHINEITVDLCRAGTDKVKFMSYTMKNCLISRVLTTSGSDTVQGFQAETVQINFGKIEWCYTVQNRSGGVAAGNVATGWDLQKNCKL